MNTGTITVQTVVNAPIEKVWECWSSPDHIMKWAFASDDWEAPAATNDLRESGKFSTTMAAKDGSNKFDFTGVYTTVVPNERIEYTMEDGRKVQVQFQEKDGGVEVTETFDMEQENSEELQRSGWQAILENFKKHAESHQ